MKRDGGPAFPCEKKYQEFTRQETPIGFPGMTLRDYFAAHCPEFPHGNLLWSQIASARYAYADAMLAERERE